MKKDLAALLLAGCSTLPPLSPDEEAFQRIMRERASLGREDAYIVHLGTGAMRSIGTKRDAQRVHYDPEQLVSELGEGYGFVHPHFATGRLPFYQATAALPSPADVRVFSSLWNRLKAKKKDLAFIIVSDDARVWVDLDLQDRNQEALFAAYSTSFENFVKQLPIGSSKETVTSAFETYGHNLYESTHGGLSLRLTWKPER